jgi:hypothetical protein
VGNAQQKPISWGSDSISNRLLKIIINGTHLALTIKNNVKINRLESFDEAKIGISR